MKNSSGAARRAPILAISILVLALPANAHPGHAASGGFVAGLLHPWTGIDHLLALLAVGLWSRQRRQGAVLVPTFLVLMALGAAGAGGLAVPALELSVAATVLLLGALAACAPSLQHRLPRAAAVMVVAACAFLHGVAHGSELAGIESGAGFLLASALLMLAGALPGERIRRMLGAAIGGAGVWLMAVAA